MKESAKEKRIRRRREIASRAIQALEREFADIGSEGYPYYSATENSGIYYRAGEGGFSLPFQVFLEHEATERKAKGR